MINKSRTRGARREGLSGSEGLLAVVGLEVTTYLYQDWYRYGEMEGESSKF